MLKNIPSQKFLKIFNQIKDVHLFFKDVRDLEKHCISVFDAKIVFFKKKYRISKHIFGMQKCLPSTIFALLDPKMKQNALFGFWNLILVMTFG